jgi:hypothetical protein
LFRPARSRAVQPYQAPHHPTACELWARIGDAVRDLNAGTLDIAAFNAVVRQALLRSADLTVARTISLPDAERINRRGAVALRQAQCSSANANGPVDDLPMPARAPERASSMLK